MAFCRDSCGWQVIVELDCIWSGDQDVQMVIKPIPHLTIAPEAVSKLLSTMIQLRVRPG